MRIGRDPWWWHALLILTVSTLYEASFIVRDINVIDEGWTLYAAQQLHRGGVLYRDVFFVFPPGHVLSAWLAYGLDPPGVFLTRVFYGAFTVSLCLALYALGRQLMPPTFALLGALLVAVAAPSSHNWELLFGYRYLVFSTLGLIAFGHRLRTGNARWMLAAGAATGVALCFRLTPALSLASGIGVAVMAASRSPRAWLEDWARFAVGCVAVAAPVVAWFGSRAGFSTLWVEAVVRPLLMTELQALPVPPLALPEPWDRAGISAAFVPVMFRLPILLYVGYLAGLGALWVRAARRRQPFPHALLLAVVIWGAVFFTRSLGRSDVPHLESALPPVCLVAAHLLGRAYRLLRPSLSGQAAGAVQAATCVGVMAAWIFLLGSDRIWYVAPLPVQLKAAARVIARQPDFATLRPWVPMIRVMTEPSAILLDMSGAPIFHVMTGRAGPGHADVLMPGTFRSPEEESAFLERLERDPPQLVIFPSKPFDGMEERAIQRWAPRLAEWVAKHYRPSGTSGKYILMVRREVPSPRP